MQADKDAVAVQELAASCDPETWFSYNLQAWQYSLGMFSTGCCPSSPEQEPNCLSCQAAHVLGCGVSQARGLQQHRRHLGRQVARQVLQHGGQRVEGGLQGLRLPAAACRQREGNGYNVRRPE